MAKEKVKAETSTTKKTTGKRGVKKDKTQEDKRAIDLKDVQEEGGGVISANEIIQQSKFLQLLEEEVLERKHIIFLYLFERYLGNVANTCRAMNISRGTFYLWKNTNERFAEIIDEENENIIDLVEDKLLDNIMKGKEISIIFFLKTKGRHRGYVERIEQDTRHEVVGFDFVDVNAEQTPKIGG